MTNRRRLTFDMSSTIALLGILFLASVLEGAQVSTTARWTSLAVFRNFAGALLVGVAILSVFGSSYVISWVATTEEAEMGATAIAWGWVGASHASWQTAVQKGIQEWDLIQAVNVFENLNSACTSTLSSFDCWPTRELYLAASSITRSLGVAAGSLGWVLFAFFTMGLSGYGFGAVLRDRFSNTQVFFMLFFTAISGIVVGGVLYGFLSLYLG